MEKVLILSFFYPPCNLTANQRVHNWAKELHKHGYYPIIITRNWDIPIHKSEDVLRSTGEQVKVETFDQYEVHYLPYKAGIRDRIYTSERFAFFRKLSKIFTFFELIFENWFLKAIPHRNLYYYSEKILQQNSSIKKLIISANPFNLFFFGYKLQKKGIQWIADYRDDWNTSELKQDQKFGTKFISAIQKKSEKKWLKNARFITSVSEYYTRKISKFVAIEGHTILNGFDEDYFNTYRNVTKKSDATTFKIVYNGSLYASQPIELFLEAMIEIIHSYSDLKFELHFPGLGFDKKQEQRVRKLGKQIEANLFITDRISKIEVIELQSNADALLLVGHNGLKGIPSSKLYEYLALYKPIIYYPNDFDIVEETLKRTNTGFIASTKIELKTQLINLINSVEKLDINKSEIAQFSAQIQVGKLAQLLNQL